MNTITPIAVLDDNYIWFIINNNNHHCLIFDPGDAKPTKQYIESQHLIPDAILLTHHHADHIDGAAQLSKEYNIPIYGPAHDGIKQVTHPLQEGDQINFPNLNLTFTILDLPGHTLGHIAYYDQHHLFPGDTLFSAGCGRIFEGSPADMYHALSKLAALPDSTQIYPAHEYTLANLRFAEAVEPENQAIKEQIEACEKLKELNQPSLPSTIAREKTINPFLRYQEKTVITAAEQHTNKKLESSADVFATLRQWKDHF